MRLLLLGATGRTGREVLELALARGHDLTAYVRAPRKIRVEHPRLSVVEGQARDPKALASAMGRHDVVISALGPLPRHALTRTTLLRDSAAAIVEAMRSAGIDRVAVVSSALLFDGGGPGVRLARRLIAPHVRDCREMEAVLEESGLQWTVARPPRLVQSPDASYRAEVGRLPEVLTLRTWLSWRGVAAFLLDSLASGQHARQVVGIARRARAAEAGPYR